VLLGCCAQLLGSCAATVTVTNTNDAPTDIVFNGDAAITLVSVNENPANGTVVATLSTVDPDNTANGINDTQFTYVLADNFGGRFEIVSNQVRILNGALDQSDASELFTGYYLSSASTSGRQQS